MSQFCDFFLQSEMLLQIKAYIQPKLTLWTINTLTIARALVVVSVSINLVGSNCRLYRESTKTF